MIRRPPKSTLFPSTPLSRSRPAPAGVARAEPHPPRGRRGDARDERDAVAGHQPAGDRVRAADRDREDRKSTRLNSSHANISYAVFCLKKKKNEFTPQPHAPL